MVGLGMAMMPAFRMRMSRRGESERNLAAQEEMEVGEETSRGMWTISGGGDWGLLLDLVVWRRVERME